MGCCQARRGSCPQVFLRYDFRFKLGDGTASQVHEVVCRESGARFAVKCVVRDEAAAQGRGGARLCQEVALMRKLAHPNICRLHEMFEEECVFYLVLELCQGCNLFERLEADIVLEEEEAARICGEMAGAVAHAHSRGVVHRDLKPESWLISEASQQGRVKLVNFDLAEACSLAGSLEQPCGTLHYVAPEVLRGRYGQPADAWTLGVVAFLMLYASYPFDGEATAGVMRAILSAEPDWSDSCYALSSEAKDFLRRLLDKDPQRRATAAEVVGHPWMRTTTPASADGPAARTRTSLRGLRSSLAAAPADDLPARAQPAAPQLLGAQGRRCSALVTEGIVNAAALLATAQKAEPGARLSTSSEAS